jgi:hypothetical protein
MLAPSKVISDNICIGGPNHGKVIYQPSGAFYDIVIPQKLEELPISVSSTPEIESLSSNQFFRYRKHIFYSNNNLFNIWLPNNISRDEALGYVLTLAASS